MTNRFDELEQAVDRRLKQIAAPRAPETLLPNVLRAVRTAPAPAAPGWAGWPVVVQAASLAALVVLTIGLIQLWPSILTIADTPIVTAVQVIWRVVVQPVGLFFVVFVTVMGATCAAFATAWRHVAFGGITR